MRHVAALGSEVPVERPLDVEEWAGGWLVACSGSHTVEIVSDCGGDARCASLGQEPASSDDCSGDGELDYPTALALVPGLGLLVREGGYRGTCVQVFATQDVFAMATMSALRVGWMVAVARGVLWRHGPFARPAGASALPPAP
jgi:hypothetical protein